MKYPNLPDYLDRRRKLMDSDIERIRELYRDGATIIEIAREYKVTNECIRRWIDENFRQKDIQKSIARSKIDWINKKQKIIDEVKESIKYMKRVSPIFVQYKNEYNRKWKMKQKHETHK